MKKHFKDYFIPHEGNSYNPHSLQKAAVVGMSVLVILSFAITNLHSLLWVSSDWLVSTILPAVIIDLTNEERESGSLKDLKHSSVLDVAAKLKAEHMAQNKYFAHFSPEGVSPWHWFDVANYNYVHAGENLAIHFTDSGDIVDAWMESPTHRANIMNGNYTEIGIGTAEGTYEGFKTVYVVQLFGTPATTALPKPVAVAEASSVVEKLTEPIKVEEEIGSEETGQVAVLSESVDISEKVEVIEPEPVLVAVDEINPKEQSGNEDPVNVDPSNEEQEIVDEETVVDMEIDDGGGVALYSDHLSTSTGGILATVLPEVEKVDSQTNFVSSLATKPHQVLQIIYAILAMFIVGSLLLSLFIEIRHQEPIQLAYSVALLLLMFGLYHLHTLFTGGVLVV